MVECKRCFTQFEFKYVEPETDDKGSYFLCPVCRHRNNLTNVGGKYGPLTLVQLDN
jgi:DNA-directed RNA polymerase subunit RPC12/RpoP